MRALGPTLVAGWVAASAMAACHRTPEPQHPDSTTQTNELAARLAAPLAPENSPWLRPSRPATEGSGGIALGWSEGRLLAFIAQEDEDILSVVDVERGSEVHALPIEGGPTQVLLLGGGRLAVSLRWANAVAILGPTAETGVGSTQVELIEKARVSTAAEPLGLATTEDGKQLLVASGLGQELAAYDVVDLAPNGAVSVPRSPRSVLVDGSQAFVTHAVGSVVSAVGLDDTGAPIGLSLLDLGLGKADRIDNTNLAEFNQAFSMVRQDGRLLVPGAAVTPGSERFTQGYGTELPVRPTVRIIDIAARSQIHERVDFEDTQTACLLPRAAANGRGHRLLIACANVDRVVELEGRSDHPFNAERRRFEVPTGPVALAVDTTKDIAVTWSNVARRVAVIDLSDDPNVSTAVRGVDDNRGAVSTFSLSSREQGRWTEAQLRGRSLFRDGRQPRISFDARSCESCHPDGGDDGLTWATPEGPRQTISLAGRIGQREQFGWFGTHQSLRQHLRHTMKRLGGAGFEQRDDQADFEALQSWLRAMPAPHRTGQAPLARSVDTQTLHAGRRAFDAAGCASCHPSGGTDGKRHDVRSGHVDEASLQFLTPSLRGVSTSGPYLHGGAFASLEQMLDQDVGPMGAPGLDQTERAALVAYLESLTPASPLPPAKGQLLPPTDAPYRTPARTDRFQKMMQQLEQERSRPHIAPEAIDTSALPFGKVEDTGAGPTYFAIPFAPEKVLAVATDVADWERDGVRFAPDRQALEFSPAICGNVQTGDWYGGVEHLRKSHNFEPVGRFVRVHVSRVDDLTPEAGPNKRYREMTGFIDRQDRVLRWTRRIDVTVAPIIGDFAYAARTVCTSCKTEQKDQLLIVVRSRDFADTLTRWSPLVAKTSATSLSTTAFPMSSINAGKPGALRRDVRLVLSWAAAEPAPTLVGWTRDQKPPF